MQQALAFMCLQPFDAPSTEKQLMHLIKDKTGHWITTTLTQIVWRLHVHVVFPSLFTIRPAQNCRVVTTSQDLASNSCAIGNYETAARFFRSFIANCREDNGSGIPLGGGYADFAPCQDYSAVHLPSRKLGRGSLEIGVVVRTCAVRRAKLPIVESGPGFGVSPKTHLHLVAFPDLDGLPFDLEQMRQTIDSVGKNPNRGFSVGRV